MTYGNYPDLSSVKKILVIKLRHLGDVLLTTPLFSTLRSRFPNAQIDAYVYKESFPMIEGHPAVNRIFGYDRAWKKLSLFGRMKKEVGLLRELRSQNYDLVFNFTEGDRGILASYLSNAPVRVGLRPKSSFQRKLLTHIGKDSAAPRHTVEKNLDLLRRIGIFPSQEDKELSFFISERDKERAMELVGREPFVMIHPTSRWRFKCWPVDKMHELAKRLVDSGKKVVITSGPDPIEQAMAKEIEDGLDVINLSGQVTLKELGALIGLSELLVCVDSLPVHIASALKKPVVAIFGPTSDVTWGPWRNANAKVVALGFSCRPCYLDGCGGGKKSECLEELPVEVVWGRLIDFFKK